MTEKKNPPSTPPSAAKDISTRSLFAFWGLLVLSAAMFSYQVREYYVDDAFIGFQYIYHAIHGEGFRFDLNTSPVEGVTNIGWLLSLIPLSLFLGAPTAAKVQGFLLTGVNIGLIVMLSYRLAKKLPLGNVFQTILLAPVLLTVFNFEWLYFSLSGMETSILSFTLLLFLWIADVRPNSWLLPLLSAIGSTFHPEALLVFPLYAGLQFFQSPQRKVFLILNLFFWAILLAGISYYRFQYFQDVVPNTFHSKSTSFFGLFNSVQEGLRGTHPNLPFPLAGIFVLVIFYFAWKGAQLMDVGSLGNALVSITATGWLFCLYSPLDWTELARYFAPYLPAAMLLFWLGVISILPMLLRKGPFKQWGAKVTGVFLIFLIGMNFYSMVKVFALLKEYPNYVLISKPLIEPVQWIEKNIPAEATIATRRVGVLAYYTNNPIFDYTHGLSDREVAQLINQEGHSFDNPRDEALEKLWKERSPEYLLEDDEQMLKVAWPKSTEIKHLTIHGMEYKILKKFPMNDNRSWILYERVK
ncbi:Hypothetical protein PBC10988_18440 [Planctomycetales bacterium 10988]|nr:Hypothetical protein PBC10988_18440 [Planctomycetales bacterium 10988]